ncbi:MAG: hypothetical protein ACJA08_002735 [Cyclobacteriaceae bacterium]|jgi:hypothetical protein
MRIYIFILCLIIVSFSFAQKKKPRDTSNYIQQVNRIEFDLGLSGDNYHIISGDELGLLVAVETSTTSTQGFQWKLHRLDTSLNMVWTKIFYSPYDSHFTGYDFYDGKYYLLFNNSKYDNTELRLYEVGSDSASIIHYEINTVFPIVLNEFEVLGGVVLLSGETNYRPVMLTYNFIDKKPKVIPGIYDKHGEILDLILDDESQMFTIIMSERTPNKRFTIIAKTFTAWGDLVQENTLNPGDKRNIIDGVATNFYGGIQYMAGTYSKKSTTYSKGLYISKFVNGRQQLVKYYDYSGLNNFFGYMTAKREQRVKERINKKVSNGKDPNFSYRLLVHDIIQRGDEFLLVAEAYYPRYSNSYNQYSTYSRYSPQGQYNSSFIGYNFTHAVVVAFDRNGNILWDNSFPIDNVLTYSLEGFVAVNDYPDKVVLMYLDENIIQSKVVSENEVVEGRTFNPVKLAYAGDELKSKDPEIEGLKTWYDKTMYAYGVQNIKNEKGEGGKVYRNIFYINKIQYHRPENLN